MTNNNDTNRQHLPLYGLKVVELSQELAASMTTMMLGDLGASVVRVCPPNVDDAPYRATLDRNKYCVTLDLHNPADRDNALDLIKNTDIVVENFDPNVLKSLGVDFAELHKQYPHIIFLSMPGFASNDNERNHYHATDAVVAASSGVFTDMGLNRILMGINPSFSPLSLVSTYGSVMATFGLLSALYHREKTGCGDVLEVPLVASLMESLSYNSIHIENYPSRYLTQRDLEIQRRRDNNIAMDMSYDAVMDLLDPFFKSYMCQDGRPLYLVCLSHRNHVPRCLKAMGLYEKLKSMGVPEVDDVHKPMTEWGTDGSINAYPLPKKWIDIIATEMAEVFLTKPAHEWEKIFGEIGVPGAQHRTLGEWVNDKHAHDTGLIIKNNDVHYGEMLQPGPIFWAEDSAHSTVAPKTRQFVDYEQALQIMSAPSVLSPPSKTVAEKVGWLDGVKILDLTNVIAGPHSGFCMTRFGAEVIKLDTIKPKYDPFCSVLYAVNQGRGKKSILIDKDTEKGREIFEKLVNDVDIVLINAANRQLEYLGLDKASLQAINDKVIFCKLDCFGGPSTGERSDYIGYDDLVQVTTGIQARFGGSLTNPEEHAHIGTIDVVCGLSAAASMAMALYCRAKEGEHKRVHTSLSALSNLLQVKYCYDYDKRGPFNEPSGPDAVGYHYQSRFYQASDGWLYLDTQPHMVDKLHGEFPDLNTATDKDKVLADAFAGQSVSHWVEHLQGLGFAISPINNIEDLRARYTRDNDNTSGIEQGSYAFTTFKDHPSGHAITIVDPYAIRPKNGKVYFVRPCEKFGASTLSVLKDYGYSEQDIATLLENKDINISWSHEYIPS